MGDLNTDGVTGMMMMTMAVGANISTLPLCQAWCKGHATINTLKSHHSPWRQTLSPQSG